MSLCVRDVMVRNVVTIDSDYSVRYAARMMDYFGISCLVAMSKEKIVGILTQGDIMTRIVAEGCDPEKVMVSGVMSKPVMVVSPTMPLEDAVKVMFKRRIKKLIVVSKEKASSRLVGLLNLTDIARLQPQMIETIKELLPMGTQAAEETVDFYVR